MREINDRLPDTFTTSKCQTCRRAITTREEAQIEQTFIDGEGLLMGQVRLVHRTEECQTLKGFTLTIHGDKDSGEKPFNSFEFVNLLWDLEKISNVNEHGIGYDGEFIYMDNSLTGIDSRQDPYSLHGWDSVRGELRKLGTPHNLDYMYPISEVMESRKKVFN